MKALLSDPYNVIITGVGGQGNVLASRIVGEMLTERGYHVTIGEIFGASQRGGSVMSHLRISAETSFSPQIPKGKAHFVVALEPTEAIRTLKDYGNPDVRVICNTRPIHAIGVICGQQSYPTLPDLRSWIRELSASAWFIDTTKAAMELGDPIFGNLIAVGALAGTAVLPLDREVFGAVVSRRFPAEKAALNATAFERGKELIRNGS